MTNCRKKENVLRKNPKKNTYVRHRRWEFPISSLRITVVACHILAPATNCSIKLACAAPTEYTKKKDHLFVFFFSRVLAGLFFFIIFFFQFFFFWRGRSWGSKPSVFDTGELNLRYLFRKLQIALHPSFLRRVDISGGRFYCSYTISQNRPDLLFPRPLLARCIVKPVQPGRRRRRRRKKEDTFFKSRNTFARRSIRYFLQSHYATFS